MERLSRTHFWLETFDVQNMSGSARDGCPMAINSESRILLIKNTAVEVACLTVDIVLTLIDDALFVRSRAGARAQSIAICLVGGKIHVSGCSGGSGLELFIGSDVLVTTARDRESITSSSN